MIPIAIVTCTCTCVDAYLFMYWNSVCNEAHLFCCYSGLSTTVTVLEEYTAVTAKYVDGLWCFVCVLVHV